MGRFLMQPCEGPLLWRCAPTAQATIWKTIIQIEPGMNALELSRKIKWYSLEQDPLCAISDDQFIPAVGRFIGVGPMPRYPRGNVGHSIGVCPQIVEGPAFTANCHERIEEGMVFTLETPWSGAKGAVVNAGYNIEDCYVVTKDGIEQFTHAPKTIYWGR